MVAALARGQGADLLRRCACEITRSGCSRQSTWRDHRSTVRPPATWRSALLAWSSPPQCRALSPQGSLRSPRPHITRCRPLPIWYARA